MLRPVLCRTLIDDLQNAVMVTVRRNIGERSTPKSGQPRGPRTGLLVVALRRGTSLRTRRVGIAQVIMFPLIDGLGRNAERCLTVLSPST